MKITPIEHASYNLVYLKENNERFTPHCKKHGAMNKITKDGFWRCISVSGFKINTNGNAKSETHAETICRAGCKEI